MYKEIREQINKVINWNKSLNNDKIISEDINQILKENGFVVQDIFDVENINGLIDSMKLSEVMPLYLYEELDFELANSGGVIIFSTDLNSTLGRVKLLGIRLSFSLIVNGKHF
jgi:hypothetical protein